MDRKVKADNVVPVAEPSSSLLSSRKFCRVPRCARCDLRLQLAVLSAVYTNQVPWH